MSIALFMGQEVPSGWQIEHNLISDKFDLATPVSVDRGLSALQLSALIKSHWDREKAKDEQHRKANQAPRNSALAQQSAGDSGGAQANLRAAISHYKSQSLAGLAAQSALGASQVRLQAEALQRMRLHQALLHQYALQTAHYNPFLEAEVRRIEPEKLPRAAPTVGEIIGHRMWSVKGGNLLTSYSAESAWFPGEPMKDATKGAEEIDDHNQVGVWAFKNPCDLGHQFNNSPGVFGTVWLWGTVIEHEKGYRAQFAAIRSLDHASDGIDLDMLRRVYLKPCIASHREAP